MSEEQKEDLKQGLLSKEEQEVAKTGDEAKLNQKRLEEQESDSTSKPKKPGKDGVHDEGGAWSTSNKDEQGLWETLKFTIPAMWTGG